MYDKTFLELFDDISVVDITGMNRFDVKTLETLLRIFALTSFLPMHFFHLFL